MSSGESCPAAGAATPARQKKQADIDNIRKRPVAIIVFLRESGRMCGWK
jgi:hypothetical protein